MVALTDSLIVIGLCLTLSSLAYVRSVFTPAGCITAFVVGVIIGIMGHLTWVILLLIFLFTSFAATKYRFDFKRAIGLQEGRRGERGHKNVIANGAVPVVIAILSFENSFYPYLDKELGSILFLAAIAVAAADTLASELGILSRNVYLITSRKRVRPGTDGGVSWTGQMWAFFAAGYTALLGTLIFHYWGLVDFTLFNLLAVGFAGFIGCQIDSVIGATLEQKGMVSKLTNNLASITMGTALVWVLITWLT